MEVSKLENKLIEIYEDTYKDVLKFVVSKCNSPDDINDLMQIIYLKFYKRLRKKEDILDYKKYLITIAKNEVYKHYGLLQRIKAQIPVFSKVEGEDFSEIELELSTEDITYNSLLYKDLWGYIKRQDLLTFKIFILYFKAMF